MRNATVLKIYKEKVVCKDIDVKSVISLLLSKNAEPIFRKDKILERIIADSKIKLGYPNQEKMSIEEISPGDASKIYIDFKFKTDFKAGGFNVEVFDQPENDVDKEFIYKTLLSQINDLKMEKQVIISSHDPLIVIIGDSNRILKATKKGIVISHKSYSLEDYSENTPITTLVSRFVDGDELALKQRYELYKGGNSKW